jgi:hypothetical protein
MTCPDRITFVTPFGALAFECRDGPSPGPAFYLYVAAGRRVLYLGVTARDNADVRELGPWAAARELGADCVYTAPLECAEKRAALERWLLACFAPPLNAPEAEWRAGAA